jgi:multidrug efflux pump subunit AcrA (membrane-fusion protein)
VQLTEARRDSIQRIIAADGILRSLDQSAIVPKISAPVRKFYVNRGDHVKQGQLLAELESSDLAAAVADAKGALDQAEAGYRNTSAATVPDEVVKSQQDVQAAKQSMDAAQALLQSREQLFKEGALAKRQVDEAAVAYAQAKSQYQTAQKHLESIESVGRHEEVKGAAGQLDSAKGKYAAALAQLSYAQIKSPISGVVVDRPVFPGEMAAAGTPLITVMDVSSVIARVNVSQAQASHVRIGQPASIAATDGSQQVTGKVSVVSPAIDPAATTVEIWVRATNPGERLRPGGTVHVTINAGIIPDAIVVPTSALLGASEGGTAVYVVGSDLVAHEKKVEVGVREVENAQIVNGIDAGVRVVSEGGVGLSDGAKVKIEKPGDDKKDDKDDKKEEKEEKKAK